jgi:hypothetical protein
MFFETLILSPHTFGTISKWNVSSLLLSILLTLSQTKVTPDLPALRLERYLENLVPIEDVHAPRDEGEIVAATRDSELPDQNT